MCYSHYNIQLFFFNNDVHTTVEAFFLKPNNIHYTHIYDIFILYYLYNNIIIMPENKPTVTNSYSL